MGTAIVKYHLAMLAHVPYRDSSGLGELMSLNFEVCWTSVHANAMMKLLSRTSWKEHRPMEVKPIRNKVSVTGMRSPHFPN